MCHCIDLANEKLVRDNTKIESIWVFGKNYIPAGIRTVKVDKTKRGNPKVIFASFCPFCGEKYDG